MVAFVLSNLAGLARQILVANAFGTQAEMEAFNAANRVSETLFNLVAGGALASAFIPTFTYLLAKQYRERAWRLASSITNLIIGITIAAGIGAAIFAPWIVRNLLAPGFADDPVKETLTIVLLRLMLPSAVIFGLSGLVMGILNSNQVFFTPALAPAMYQLGMIFGVLVLSPSLGIFGLGWGVLIGAALHLGLQVPALFRLRGKYALTLGMDSPDVREVARLMGPRLLGVAVVQLNFWINTRLASQFVEGSVTGIVLGFALMLMPQAAIAQSIAIAALPTFSAQVAQNRMSEMRHSLASSLRAALLLSIPASLGLLILRKPIIQVLYQRGQFDERSTELVAWALLWFSAGLVGHALVEILSRAFYSLHDTKTPVYVGIAAMSLNVIFSYLFSSLFLRIGWLPHGGLALANSVATGLEAVGLVIIMRRRLSGLEGLFILEGIWKSIAATLAMGIALLAWLTAVYAAPAWVVATGGIAFGGASFLLIAFALGVGELRSAAGYLKRRLAG
jgi:putative peptidoglycan lipid II flippase